MVPNGKESKTMKTVWHPLADLVAIPRSWEPRAQISNHKQETERVCTGNGPRLWNPEAFPHSLLSSSQAIHLKSFSSQCYLLLKYQSLGLGGNSLIKTTDGMWLECPCWHRAHKVLKKNVAQLCLLKTFQNLALAYLRMTRTRVYENREKNLLRVQNYLLGVGALLILWYFVV